MRGGTNTLYSAEWSGDSGTMKDIRGWGKGVSERGYVWFSNHIVVGILGQGNRLRFHYKIYIRQNNKPADSFP